MRSLLLLTLLPVALLASGNRAAGAERTTEPVSFSGIYPHLAYWNREAECGTGAVVPWAGRLWVITYGPHLPNGSSDKLYEIDERLQLTVRPESVGGTHANRMIHRESEQLFVGPYTVSKDRNVRVIPPARMPGRLTGTARHLSDPANRVYFATMEEGFYEVDVRSLEVKELYPDANGMEDRSGPLLPGYHGKGLFTGQGRLVYANNGEHSEEARKDPATESGCLAEWQGGEWQVVRRNQFTEVSGPGEIAGGNDGAANPVWSIGWDHRSLILMLLDEGRWSAYRLPKASHCYDGAHGWNTEWPRIREIGEKDLLMTMHGAFWRFPRAFSRKASAGIVPRSTYLKVVGDFCRWGERVVLGCDDAARNEFLNKRKAKGEMAGPAISHSNLWWLAPEELDRLGPVRGTGAVWLKDKVRAGEVSEPYMFSGFERRAVLLAHDSGTTVSFTFELDRRGDDRWEALQEISVPAEGSRWIEFPASEQGAWVRVRADRDCDTATVLFSGSDADRRSGRADGRFAGLAKRGASEMSGGLLHAGGTEEPVLRFAPTVLPKGPAKQAGYYEMGADLKLRRVEMKGAREELERAVQIPDSVVTSDAASLIYTDDAGLRFRLPRREVNDGPGITIDIPQRICREVCTERDLFSAGGTFYELPAENAGGFLRVRPIASHGFLVSDYCSWRGLLVLSGVAADAPANEHIVRSEDGECAVWLGAVDDLWKLGKPSGQGGPWKDSLVSAGVPSDPYLANGFDQKRLTLSHDAETTVVFTVEADFAGDGTWHRFQELPVAAEEVREYQFPDSFAAYWLRVTAGTACRATAEFVYD